MSHRTIPEEVVKTPDEIIFRNVNFTNAIPDTTIASIVSVLAKSRETGLFVTEDVIHSSSISGDSKKVKVGLKGGLPHEIFQILVTVNAADTQRLVAEFDLVIHGEDVASI